MSAPYDNDPPPPYPYNPSAPPQSQDQKPPLPGTYPTQSPNPAPYPRQAYGSTPGVVQQPVPPPAVGAPPPMAMGPTPLVYGTRFGEFSTRTTCPHCQAEVTTHTHKTIGMTAWLGCLGIAFSALFVGVTIFCCWLPFVIPACKDTVHTCPNCNKVLGVKKLI